MRLFDRFPTDGYCVMNTGIGNFPKKYDKFDVEYRRNHWVLDIEILYTQCS